MKKHQMLPPWRDRKLEDITFLLHHIYEENHRQIKKWGVQTHSAFEWLAYLTEEIGELAEAISEAEYRGGDKKEIIKEAMQVATLALKIAEMARTEKV